MKPLRSTDLALVGALALAVRLAFAWAIPFDSGSRDPNCAPDEGAHLQFALDLAHGRAPTWPRETRSIYSVFVPAPYAMHAATAAAVGSASFGGLAPRFAAVDAWARPYFAARLGGVLIGVATVLLVALAAATWTGERGAGIAAGLATALYPQLAFVNAYVNSDSFTVFAGIAMAWALAGWVRRGEGVDGAATVGLAAALVLVGKPSGYFVLPPAAAWLGWAAWRHAEGRRVVLRAGGVALAVAGPMFAWNAVRMHGDVLGLEAYHQFLTTEWHGRGGNALPDAFRILSRQLPASAFGVFRNLNLPLPRGILTAAAVLACGGLAASALRLRRATPHDFRCAAFIATVAVVSLALVVYHCWFVDFAAAQGRYLLVPAVLVTTVGLWAPVGLVNGAKRFAWPVGCVAFLAVATLVGVRLVYLNPCLP